MAKVLIGNVKPVKGVDYLTEEDIAGLGAYFAPAKYGLGGQAKNVSDGNLDSCVFGGAYSWQKAENSPFDWGYMIVIPAYLGEGLVQIAYSMIKELQGCVAQRTLHAWNKWGEWEYANPLLVSGKEYRTTERYGGKPVYAYLANVGAFPETGARNAEVNIESTGLVRFNAVAGDYLLPVAGKMEINAYRSSGKIVVQMNTAGARLSTSDVFVTIYYTKT